MSTEDSSAEESSGAGPVEIVRSGVDGAVPKALSILEALARSHSPVRLTALAHELGIQKSTVHRILSTLTELDYVSQDRATGRYRASLKLWEMGARILAEHPVKRAAAGFLANLQRVTGETVSLLLRAGDDVLYLEKLVSARAVGVATRAGSRVPAVLTAGGKAMLAYAPDARAVAERAALRIQHPPFDAPAFLRELESIRARGYALSSFSPGVVSVGAPIGYDRPHAALSVSGPRERFTKASQARIVEIILAAGAQTAEALGRP